MQSPLQPPRQPRELNQIIDCVLRDPTPAHKQAMLALVTPHGLYRLAERVRRRATLLARTRRKNAQNLLTVRDILIMALYAETSPADWANAWCDGSSISHNNERRAGIGVIVYSHSGDCVTQISLPLGKQTAFEAEIQAIAFALHIAATHHIMRIRLHTDNKGLTHLWRKNRQDSRLIAIRENAGQFEKLQIRPIPRLHNQAANRLAKQAAATGRESDSNHQGTSQ